MTYPSSTKSLPYLTLYESTPAILHSIGSSGRLAHVSNAWLDAFGYTRREVIGQLWVSFLTPTSRTLALGTVIPKLFKYGSCKDVEYQVVRKDGKIVDILLSAVVETQASGSPSLSLTYIQDVTEPRRLRTALAAQLELSRVTLDSIADGVIRTDAKGLVEYLNPVAERLTGWTATDARGRHFTDVFNVLHRFSRFDVSNLVDDCLRFNRFIAQPHDSILVSRDKSEYIIEDSATPIRNSNGSATGVVLVFYDVSDQRRLTDELRYRATHDGMTDLFNRYEFERHLEACLSKKSGESQHCALLFIDLDGFKLVNDAAGHGAGDQLLKHIASILKVMAGEDDIVARLGGDEFAFIVKGRSCGAAQELAENICRRIDAFRFFSEGERLHVGASVGLAVLDDRWPNAESALRAADGACYAAKQAGRNRVHTYSGNDPLVESHHHDMLWVRKLETALDKNQFVLHWQRIYPLKPSVEGIHCEMLLRLQSEDGSLIAPGSFFCAAERFFVASRIDRWVVTYVLDWISKNKNKLSGVHTFAINLSAHSIGDRAFLDFVLLELRKSGIDCRKLCFEITETATITNFQGANLFFEGLKSLGVRFALDDFGSGASSFAYLKNLPVDYLKIDGQFIRNLCGNEIDQATVRCIQEVARITGKQTVAEFVENEDVENLLRDMKIDYAQGFLRHFPSPLETLLSLDSAG